MPDSSSLEEFRELLRSIRENPSEVRSPIFLRAAKLFEQRVFHYTVDGEVLFEPNEYLSYEEAIEKASRIQPKGYDRFNPTVSMNREFFSRVKGFLPGILKDSLELIITVGTEFDYFHGGDAVCRISHKGFSAFVSLDATINDKKIEAFRRKQKLSEQAVPSSHWKLVDMNNEVFFLQKDIKSDFVISPEDIDNGTFLEVYPREIASILISRLVSKIEGQNYNYDRICFRRALPI